MRNQERHARPEYWLLCLLLVLLDSLAAAAQTDPLQLTAVEPKSGVTTPGSKVTVYGTSFSSDAVVYIGGLQVRETKFINPSKLEVLTPYLRPGEYKIQLKSGGITIRSDLNFTAVASPIDVDIDRAMALGEQGHTATAVDILSAIAQTYSDYQVRAFANYQTGQTYYAQGNFSRWGWTTTFLDADKSGMSVQTSWRYRLDSCRQEYFLNAATNPDYDLKSADWVVKHDITEHPEPRFFRGLLNARHGNLEKAKEDTAFILRVEPSHPSYRALAAYVAVLQGDKTQLESFSGAGITDARALGLLGEAAYLSGDSADARRWWMLAEKEYPLGASLAFLAGKKHLARGHKRIAAALLTQCTVMAPNSKEAKEAQALLANLEAPGN